MQPRRRTLSEDRSAATNHRRVELVPHDPTWPQRYRTEGRRIDAALGSTAIRIEHVGSTAVPGLAAKPVIDIQVSVASFEPMERYRTPLERLGYRHRSDDEPEHRFFSLDEGVSAR